MALPRVKIFFETGAIGPSSESEDGVVGLVASGVAVADKFSLGEPYLITKLEGLNGLGITSDEEDVNANIYKVVKEFYTEATEGTKLWILAAANTVTMANLVDKTQEYAKKLIEAANGAINFLIVAKSNAVDYTPTIVDGLDTDVYAAMINAQALGEWATESRYAPVFIILPGRHYTGIPANLRNLSESENNRVAILIGDTINDSDDAAVGLLAGRIAAIPVQRSIARVKSGAIKVDDLYIGDGIAENGNPDLIHDAGFITFRTFVGKAGYYFSDDKLATATDDDYALIPRRRVIDKAYRIGYQTLVDELGDELPVTNEGTIPAAIIKSIQNTVEVAIENKMTANGNLGVDPDDPNDTGVECFIDKDQNIVSSSRLQVRLRVKPFGYPKYIDLYLGFKTSNT